MGFVEIMASVGAGVMVLGTLFFLKQQRIPFTGSGVGGGNGLQEYRWLLLEREAEHRRQRKEYEKSMNEPKKQLKELKEQKLAEN
jgi:hypothetical protein